MGTTPDQNAQPAPRWRRWVWFLGIWAASVLALTVVSQLIRWMIMP